MKKFKLSKKIAAFSLCVAMALPQISYMNVNAEEYTDDSATATDAEYAVEEIETEEETVYGNYSYAKLLQYSLYLYDANMCGTDVDENSLLDWRGDCHKSDKTTYNGVSVDVTGGFHDAGDHVKFGLPEAYSAFVLGMSYYTDKSAYQSTKQEGHLKTITNRFADYLKRCAVYDGSGNVQAYVVQVGDGNTDHNYWGSPEKQTTSRPISFATSSAPSTDIVALSAAALTMNYMNFKDASDLTAAKKIFAFAKKNSKATDKFAGSFYASSGWADDYCLAALLLYKATGDSSYLSEYNSYKSQEKAKNVYWPLGWDNVAPAIAYFNNDANSMKNLNNVSYKTLDGVYRCYNDWGSVRYNTSMQYTLLLIDKLNKSSSYLSMATSNMNYILGDNTKNICFVTGFASNSAKYPHHRAASGYTGSVQGTKAQAHVLIGAAVGGPSTSNGYQDTASNYQYNEVAIDYNATLVAAAAALCSAKSLNSSTIDPNYYSDDNQNSKLTTTGMYIAKKDRTGFNAGLCIKYQDESQVQFCWSYVDLNNPNQEYYLTNWGTGNQWVGFVPPKYGEYKVIARARVGEDNSTMVGVEETYSYHPYIEGTCQMPNSDGGYLIGLRKYSNTPEAVYSQLLILDCTLYAQGKPAWVHSSGYGEFYQDGMWTVWQPKYGYYWTLFRVYDANYNIIDEVVYGFQNI